MAWTGRTGMFADFNFKLVVINDILNKSPSFAAELAARKKQYVEPYEMYRDDKCIPEMVSWFERLRLTEEDLRKVTALWFDGGNEVYFLLKPDWDGELDIFDVTSVEGFERLENLEAVEWTSMCEPEVLRPIKEKGIPIRGFLTL